MSLVEWTCALDGYITKMCGDQTPEIPCTRDELEELMEKYPDGDRNTS